MGIFGSSKSPQDRAAKSDIPEEIYRQVRVMGDLPARAFSQGAESTPGVSPSVPEAPQAPVQPNPFLSEVPARPVPEEALSGSSAPAVAQPPKNLPLNPAPESVPLRLGEAPSKVAETLRPSGMRKYLIWGLSGLLLLVIIGGAGYFVFFANAPVETADPVLLPPAESPAPEAPRAPEVPPFSLTGANYLPINTETSTPESILAELAAQEAKMQDSGIEVPVKFLVTDQNNIPIAFSRFAFLLGLPLESELINLFEESFSLYLYNDGGAVRRGLVLSVDTEQARFLDEQLQGLEGDLPEALRPIFYPAESFDLRNPVFATGNFNGQPVRYVNFDLERNFSFDYLKTEALLIFGNSKNMVRAVLSAEESGN